MSAAVGGSSPSRAVRRRNALMGAVGGFLGGFGLSLTYNQSQGLLSEWIAGISVVSILLGAALGWFDPPKLIRQILSVATLSIPLIGLPIAASPAISQDICDVRVEFDGPVALGDARIPAATPFGLGPTGREAPLILNLDSISRIAFEVPEAAPASTLTVSVGQSDPGFVVTDRAVVFHGPVGGGSAGLITVEESGLREVGVRAGETSVARLPFGLVRLDAEVAAPDGSPICERSVWVRFVSNPFSDLPGLLAIFVHLIGIGTSIVALNRSAVPVPPLRPPIPSRPAVPKPIRVESRLRDASGRPVGADQPLLVGSEYTFEIELTLDLEEDDDEPQEAQRVVLTSPDIPIDLSTKSVDLGRRPETIELPLTPTETGRNVITLDVIDAGGLVRSERFHLQSVSPNPGTTDEVHEAITTFQGPFFRSGVRRRAVTVILYREEGDQTVDLRVLDSNGAHLVTYDTPVLAPTLDSATQAVRTELVYQLTPPAGFGVAFPAETDQLDAWLPPLAAAGRALAMELLPEPPGSHSGIPNLASAGDIIQVNQDDAGLGHATIPWNLIYDRPVLLTDETRVCDSFSDHDPDLCPHDGNSDVVCPYGFWGFRYIVEQPPTWVHEDVAALPIRVVGRDDRPVVNINGDPSFELWAEHQNDLVELDAEIRVATDFAGLRAIWSEGAAELDVIYFYTHHSVGAQPFIEMGTTRIDRTTLDGLGVRWGDAPLVVLAGCGTGAQQLASYAPLIDEFRVRGSSAVVGSEAVVTEAVASRAMTRFLEKVIGGQPIGPALLAVRRETLHNDSNPAGLMYSLYGMSDLQSADPRMGEQ